MTALAHISYNDARTQEATKTIHRFFRVIVGQTLQNISLENTDSSCGIRIDLVS